MAVNRKDSLGLCLCIHCYSLKNYPSNICASSTAYSVIGDCSKNIYEPCAQREIGLYRERGVTERGRRGTEGQRKRKRWRERQRDMEQEREAKMEEEREKQREGERERNSGERQTLRERQ